jgi:hypothetical protein
MHSDPEKDAVELKYVHGYPSLADFIASDPEHSTAIYRRFDFLSARNLLFLQSEVVELEADLRRFDQEDLRNTQTEDSDSARDFKTFHEKAKDAQSGEAKRLKTAAADQREAQGIQHATSILASMHGSR